MKIRTRIAACALSAALTMLVTMLAGCSGGAASNTITPPAAGYIPTQVSQLASGGILPDGEPSQQHDDGVLSLNDLEGQWICESMSDEHRDSKNPESYVVTEKSMVLNEQKIECLPKSIDIRPYSPTTTLFAQGFGYGAALFADATDSDGTGINRIEMHSSLPYGGNGFICTVSGSTLALGFLGSDYKMEDDGTVVDKGGNAVDEYSLIEADYEVTLDGDRLTISCGDASASYVPDRSAVTHFHKGSDYALGLYDGDKQVDPFKFQNMKKLSEAGYGVNCDMNELLPSLNSSKEFSIKAPGGSVFKAKVFNPYEKNVPLWYLPISWYQFEGDGSDLTIGMTTKSSIDLGMTQVFGSSSYAQVYNYYPMPYESSEDYLCYKTGAAVRMLTITSVWSADHFDAGNTLVESKHSCDVRFGFTDGILTSFTKEDSAYTSAGLQDNVAHDDLGSLTPSVYREATERRDRILDELKKAFRAAGIDASVNEKTGEVVMDNSVLFAADSFELGDEGKAYLDKVFTAYASVVLDGKYSPVLKGVSFEGNTDSDGDSEYNMRLSENRANAVMGYCSGLLGERQRATFDELAACRGYGESDLVYDERGNEDKGASRRVAIKFMLNVDDLKSEAGSQGGGGSASGASAPSSSSAASDSASSSTDAKDGSGDLGEFRRVSNKFDQAWSLYEESQSDGSLHVAVLLLSKDHGYCGYFDLRVDASSTASGSYTFGEASVEDKGSNMQTITVRHGGDEDKLDVIFNAWGKDGMVSVKDPWGGVYALTAVDDVGAATSAFEGILPE